MITIIVSLAADLVCSYNWNSCELCYRPAGKKRKREVFSRITSVAKTIYKGSYGY